MHKPLTITRLALAAALGVLLLSGCSVTKVNYERNAKGEVSYRLYRNDHWLKTESTGIQGGMTKDGKFEFSAEGLKSSPSEEFNRTMQTYTTAFVQLAQIAAAAYNPSASSAIQSAASKSAQQDSAAISERAASAATKDSAAASPKASSATQSAAISDRAASAADCPGGACEDKDCPGGSCTDKDCPGGSCTDKDCAGGACTAPSGAVPVNICTGEPLSGTAK